MDPRAQEDLQMDQRRLHGTPRELKEVQRSEGGGPGASKIGKVRSSKSVKTISFSIKIEHLEVTVRQCMPLLEFIWYFNASRRHGDVVEDLWWSLVSSGNALGEHMGRLVSQEDVQR